MGIQDRGYMNGTEEAMHASGRRYTAVIALVAINAAVWILWQFTRSDALHEVMFKNFTVSADGVLRDLRLHTLLTNCISHQNLWHILFNMFFFCVVGVDVERIYGFKNFFWLYIFCGVGAALAHIGVDVFAARGGLRFSVPALGASGSIMGVAVVAAVFDPMKPISLMGLITLPLRLLVIIYIVFDILGAMDGGGAIAHSAHLGGALAGFLFWKLDLRLFASPGRRNVGLLYHLRSWLRRRPRLTVVEKIPEELPREPVAQPGPARARRAGAGSESRAMPERSSRVDAATSLRVDELLGKISSQGMHSLTDEERAFLKESSQKYRKN